MEEYIIDHNETVTLSNGAKITNEYDRKVKLIVYTEFEHFTFKVVWA